MKASYKGLVNYIASKYNNVVEIGIGHFPDVAFALLERRVRVYATDIRSFKYDGLDVIMDDVTKPDLSIYKEIDLIYSLRPPPEIVPYMEQLAKKLSTDLIVKPLSSEYIGGKLIRHVKTTFFIWNYL